MMALMVQVLTAQLALTVVAGHTRCAGAVVAASTSKHPWDRHAAMLLVVPTEGSAIIAAIPVLMRCMFHHAMDGGVMAAICQSIGARAISVRFLC